MLGARDMDELTESEFECLYRADLEQPLTRWQDAPTTFEIWLDLIRKELAELDVSTDVGNNRGPLYALVPTERGRDVLAEISPLRKMVYCVENGFKFNAQILVDELSKEELPVALTSDNTWVREEAISRLKELEC